MFLIIILLTGISAILCLVLFPVKKTWVKAITYINLGIMVSGYVVYIIKAGGYSSSEGEYFFFSTDINRYIVLLPIKSVDLYYVTNITRLIFPYLLLLDAVVVTYVSRPAKRKFMIGILAAAFIPILILINIFEPSAYYRQFAYKFDEQIAISCVVLTMIMSYFLIAVGILLRNRFTTGLRWYKRKWNYQIVSTIALFAFYLVFAFMDPVTMMQDYKSIVVGPFSYFLNAKMDRDRIFMVTSILLVAIIINLYAAMKYVKVDYDYEKQEIAIKKNVKDAKKLSDGFMHGMKNQLLAMKIQVDRLQELNSFIDKTEEEKAEISDLINNLAGDNIKLIQKMSHVHKALSEVKIKLESCNVWQAGMRIQAKCDEKYPDVDIEIIKIDGVFLGDGMLLEEGLMNIIDNAVDAVKMKKNGKVTVEFKFTKDLLCISVGDNGFGISKKMRRKMYLPFNSDKNSTERWGFGLCQTREIVKKHMGYIRCETSQNGTTFYITLPRLKVE